MFRLSTKHRQVSSSSLGMQADVTGLHSHSQGELTFFCSILCILLISWHCHFEKRLLHNFAFNNPCAHSRHSCLIIFDLLPVLALQMTTDSRAPQLRQ
ncbi:hypothetical protein BDV40DRAFT_27327 [Aspergillus tamarii]|uniref:Uncharacterized protein n=1 Tax=Aspergillus tamarii TaxID=41984 RepID=A0A5N6UHU8_ASPTM|nr:hypothetical protein BDV40DRAFT_27327 [Aspergillus tamarii]